MVLSLFCRSKTLFLEAASWARGSSRASLRLIFTSRDLHTSAARPADLTPLRKHLKDAAKAHRLGSEQAETNWRLNEDVVSRWKLTVGIEIHAQLNASRKLFSKSPSEFDTSPNRRVSGFDIAVPGTQPTFQKEILIPALRAAIALNCSIEQVSRFDRKHYFYHDQPSGYQLTQYYQPFARDGSLLLSAADGLPTIDGDEVVVGIKQIQMEQDTAKTQELEDGTSLIDFTRSGQPLIEIISLPHIHSPEAAAAYLRKVQTILYSVDAVTTGMELGGLRADVNVSVAPYEQLDGGHSYGGVSGLGQRTEIKNLSSFKAVEDAVKAERNRQIAILEAGGAIEGETRGWSASKPGETRRLRGKEGEVDYRYMPDPDIPPLYISKDVISSLRMGLPPTPDRLVAMLASQYGLSAVDAKALIVLDNGERLVYFQTVVDLLSRGDASEMVHYGIVSANWILHEVGSLLASTEQSWTPSLVPAPQLTRIVQLQAAGRITGTSAKIVLRRVFQGDREDIDDIVSREGLWFEAMSDTEYRSLVQRVLDENPVTVTEIQEKGRHGKIKFLMGQMMRFGDRNRIEAARAEALLRQSLLGSDRDEHANGSR